MPDLAKQFARDGFVVFDADPRAALWATRAYAAGCEALADPVLRQKWLRHGETWFVGVDALPNAPDGSIGAAPLAGPWSDLVPFDGPWHCAQLSVVFEGYPKRDEGETEAAHRYRIKRCAAHVDGLHLEQGRRILREPHRFILGLPLNDSDACPLVVWPCSHLAMRDAFAAALGENEPMGADLTEVYTATRAACFETCAPVEVSMKPGQAVLLDRHLLHGVAPWRDAMHVPPEGRMVAYFRPECASAADWV